MRSSGARTKAIPKLLASPAWIAIATGVFFTGPKTTAQQTQTAAGEVASSPLVITLEDAIRRSLVNDPAYAAGAADRGIAKLNRSIGRSTLLPQASFHGQYLYTQPNGSTNQAGQSALSQPSPRFIANNAIREYATQVLVSETVNAANFADYRRLSALASKAQADLEVVRRDLIVTVVSNYFTVVATGEKLEVARRAFTEATNFVELTKKLEGGREVAHADVVKAELSSQQREREVQDAQLEAEKTRLQLGTFLFPDPRTDYRTADAGTALPPMPLREDAEAAAARGNPDLRSAVESLSAARSEVSASRAAYLPSLSLDYNYGIDAPQLAVNGPDGIRNLGYSAVAGIDLPVWDWFALHDRVKQSQLRQKVAETTLTFTQRQLIAQFEEFYNEARVASGQIASLETSAATAAESLRLTKLRYRAGEATALEVVDAQNALAVADSTRADGTVRYRVALANLQTLTGAL